MKKINIILIIFFSLTSCAGFQEAGKVLRNEKVNSTDEFLVKKRDPLILPPNYEDLPKPDSRIEDKKEKKNALKKILNASNEETSSKNSSSSTEKTILNRIRN